MSAPRWGPAFCGTRRSDRCGSTTRALFLRKTVILSRPADRAAIRYRPSGSAEARNSDLPGHGNDGMTEPAFFKRPQGLSEIGRATSELQSLAYLVCRLLLEK